MEVDHVLTLCTSIYRIVENAKANKERCQRVAKRVKALEELVLTIKQRGLCQFSDPVNNALREIYQTLSSAKALITKFTEAKPVMNILKSSSNEDKFAKINERLNDNFQILSGALQIEHGDTLNRMCHTLSRCRSLSQQGDTPDRMYNTLPRSHSLDHPPEIGFGNPTSLMSQDSVSSPTAPPMTPRPLMSPTASPMITPAIPVTTPTAAMPVRSVMPPMSPSPMIPMPTPSIMPVNNPIMPVNFCRPIAPSVFAPTVVSQPYVNTVFIPPKPVIRTIAPVTVRPVHTVTQMFPVNTPQMAFSQTNQTVVTTYVVKRPF
ncbi:mucin-2-like [Sphaeramia orbicularis]|uniref:Mucin-2-like n=1 Tax=Sphaeramia orbicularis TaxID=375764 RepID=A0A672YA18_9TELE|nr:mucin-2-like [Sphaeramia orbicularis]